jgi:hypothetical protein
VDAARLQAVGMVRMHEEAKGRTSGGRPLFRSTTHGPDVCRSVKQKARIACRQKKTPGSSPGIFKIGHEKYACFSWGSDYIVFRHQLNGKSYITKMVLASVFSRSGIYF